MSQDIAFLVTRDYNFHTWHHQPMSHQSPPQSTLEPAILQGPPQQQMMSNFNLTSSAPNPLEGRPWMVTAASTASFIPRTMFQ